MLLAPFLSDNVMNFIQMMRGSKAVISRVLAGPQLAARLKVQGASGLQKIAKLFWAIFFKTQYKTY